MATANPNGEGNPFNPDEQPTNTGVGVPAPLPPAQSYLDNSPCTGGYQRSNGTTSSVICTGTGNVSAQEGSVGSIDAVQIFRNVDATEFDSIAITGMFGTGNGAMEGKWFATQGEHADVWGHLLNLGQGLTVTTWIPRWLADQLHYHAGKLDGVGPGYYADCDQLAQINELMSGIELWP